MLFKTSPIPAGVQVTRLAPPKKAVHVAYCPDCRIERADFEGRRGKFLETCPNCGTDSAPRLRHLQAGAARKRTTRRR